MKCMENDVILKAEQLFYKYEGEKNYSLNGLSLEIHRGKKVAFMGANGSGKSTFFLCCNGILRPSAGKVYFDGMPLDYSRKGLLNLRSNVGIVFQDPDNQLFCASVYQEISFGPLNMGLPEKQVEGAVEKIITDLEIQSFRHKPTHALSGGQKKQVSIADILVMNPKVIILDEPAAALDPKHNEMVNNLIDQLSDEGITVLVSTHDVDYALSWADEIFLFKDGQILASGNPETVFCDNDILKKADLPQPAAIKIFYCLCEQGLLDPNSPIPRSIAQLENYIKNISK